MHHLIRTIAFANLSGPSDVNETNERDEQTILGRCRRPCRSALDADLRCDRCSVP